MYRRADATTSSYLRARRSRPKRPRLVSTEYPRRGESRRDRGCDVHVPQRRTAATPRLPRGYSVETNRGDGATRLPRNVNVSATASPRFTRERSAVSAAASPRFVEHVRAANALREDEARRRRVGEGLARVNIVPGPPRCSPADYPRRHARRRREWLVLRYRTYGRFSNGALTPRCYSPLLIGSPRRGRGVAATDEPRTPERYIMKCTKSIASTP